MSKPFFNWPFWKFVLGVCAIFITVVIAVVIVFYTKFPSDYVVELVVRPKETPTQSKFTYKVINPSPDTSITGDELTLVNSGQFPDLAKVDTWLNQSAQPFSPTAKTVKVVTVGRMYCEYCLNLYPYLSLLHERYRDKVMVLGVLYQKYDGELSEELINKYINDTKVMFPIGLDKDKDFIKSLNIDIVPATYVIDQDNEIVYYQIGLGNFDKIDGILKLVLNKQPAAGTEQ